MWGIVLMSFIGRLHTWQEAILVHFGLECPTAYHVGKPTQRQGYEGAGWSPCLCSQEADSRQHTHSEVLSHGGFSEPP